jgi:hypothetical protein
MLVDEFHKESLTIHWFYIVCASRCVKDALRPTRMSRALAKTESAKITYQRMGMAFDAAPAKTW